MTSEQISTLLDDPQTAHFVQLVGLINDAPEDKYDTWLTQAESGLESWPDALRQSSTHRFFDGSEPPQRCCELHLWRHLSRLAMKSDQVPVLLDLIQRSTLITQLTLSGKFGRSGLKELLSLPQLSSLQLFEVAGQSNANAKALIQAEHLGQLRSLSWLRGALDGKMLAQMMKAPHLQQLELLDLRSNDKCGDPGVEILAKSRHFGALRSLGLFYTGISDKGAKALFEADGFGQLAALDLSSNEALGDEALHSLARASHWQHLRLLDLSNTGISDDGILRLSEAAHLSGLQALLLSGNQLTDQSAAAIAASESFKDLFYLDLSSNQLTPQGLEALLDSPHLQSLKRLKVGANRELWDVGTVDSQHPLALRLKERGILLNEQAHMGPLSLELLPTGH